MKKALHYLNHQPYLIKSRDWQEIIDFYKKLNIEPMLDLAEYVSADYSYGICATTSMFMLCLAQTPEFELYKNVLRVNFCEMVY